MTWAWFVLGAIIAVPCHQLISQYLVQDLLRAKSRIGDEVACLLGLLGHLVFGTAWTLGFAVSTAAPLVARGSIAGRLPCMMLMLTTAFAYVSEYAFARTCLLGFVLTGILGVVIYARERRPRPVAAPPAPRAEFTFTGFPLATGDVAKSDALPTAGFESVLLTIRSDQRFDVAMHGSSDGVTFVATSSYPAVFDGLSGEWRYVESQDVTHPYHRFVIVNRGVMAQRYCTARALIDGAQRMGRERGTDTAFATEGERPAPSPILVTTEARCPVCRDAASRRDRARLLPVVLPAAS